MENYNVFINNETYIFNFEKEFNKDIHIEYMNSYMILLIHLSMSDINFNLIYYVGNKERFDKIYKVPINKILNYIDDFCKNFENKRVELFKKIIIQKYNNIYILQTIYNNTRLKMVG